MIGVGGTIRAAACGELIFQTVNFRAFTWTTYSPAARLVGFYHCVKSATVLSSEIFISDSSNRNESSRNIIRTLCTPVQLGRIEFSIWRAEPSPRKQNSRMQICKARADRRSDRGRIMLSATIESIAFEDETSSSRTRVRTRLTHASFLLKEQ